MKLTPNLKTAIETLSKLMSTTPLKDFEEHYDEYDCSTYTTFDKGSLIEDQKIQNVISALSKVELQALVQISNEFFSKGYEAIGGLTPAQSSISPPSDSTIQLQGSICLTINTQFVMMGNAASNELEKLRVKESHSGASVFYRATQSESVAGSDCAP